jgi:sugar phosphate isomerase/epimerase
MRADNTNQQTANSGPTRTEPLAGPPKPLEFSRRCWLMSLVGGWASRLLAAESSGRSKLGLVEYCWGLHLRARRQGQLRAASDPLAFLEDCRGLGAGGIQTPIPLSDAAYLGQVRQTSEQHGIFIEAILDLPRDRTDVERFDKQVRCARQAGATLGRAVLLPGRRYEQFASLEAFQRADAQGRTSLELAEPVAARHRFFIAVENHKDHRVTEKLALLQRLSSEYVGLCVDVINNFALCEDSLESTRALAPWALTVHLKDQAVRECADGFLLADMPLGQGFLDLPALVRVLRQARPAVRFNLEAITRDPIKVPVLTDRYYATFPDLPASDLARTLSTVKAKSSPGPLPTVSHLPLEQQLERERQTVQTSLRYAREHLGL